MVLFFYTQNNIFMVNIFSGVLHFKGYADKPHKMLQEEGYQPLLGN